MKTQLFWNQFVGALILIGTTCALAAESDKKPLSNEDVLKMVKEGLPEQTIVLTIQNNPGNYNTSADAIVALNKEHVPAKVLDAMLTRNQQAPPPTEDRRAARGGGFGMKAMGEVWYIDGTNRVALTQSKGEIEQTMAVFVITMRTEFQGRQAAFRVTKSEPEFEVALLSNVAPEEYVGLIKPKVTKDKREIPMGGAQMFGQIKPDKKKLYIPVGFKEVRKDTSSAMDFTVYRVKPSAPLPAGEYILSASGQYYCFGVDL